MMTAIELPSLAQGEYQLDVFVKNFLFFNSGKANIQTCLNFNLLYEFVATRQHTSKTEVLSILPMIIADISVADRRNLVKIEVRFKTSGNFEFEQKMCRMVSNEAAHEIIFPERYVATGEDSYGLYFRFLDSSRGCYHIECSTDEPGTNSELERIRDSIGPKTNYCIADPYKRCNPNAMPTLSNGKCQCSYPYRGNTCEDCADHYLRAVDDSHHAVCTLDLTKCSQDYCNSHGDCI